MILGVGTYLEAKDFYNNPTWEQAGWTTLSALGDASMIFPIIGGPTKAAITSAKVANTIGKAAKLSKAERFVPLLQDANKARKVAHAKMLEDITWPALYGTMVRPAGVTLTMPYRTTRSAQTPIKYISTTDAIPSNQSIYPDLIEPRIGYHKEGSKLKKYENPGPGGITYDAPTEADRAKISNQYHANKATYYAQQEPSAKNVLGWLWNKFLSIPWLGGEDESGASYGMAPSPGKAAGALKAAKSAKAAKAASYSTRTQERIQKAYNSLSEVDRRNFDLYLKRGNETLENMSWSTESELMRLSRGNFKPSTIDPIISDRSSWTTDKMGNFDYTKTH